VAVGARDVEGAEDERLAGHSCVNGPLQGGRSNLALTKLQPKVYSMYHGRHLCSLRNIETGPVDGSDPGVEI
jgi:hypothetical protein